jgi:hypothetical protein
MLPRGAPGFDNARHALVHLTFIVPGRGEGRRRCSLNNTLLDAFARDRLQPEATRPA